MTDEGAERRPTGSIVATGKGDDGTTGLLYASVRIPKDDARTEAVGTIDEAVAALGLARAELALKQLYGVVGPQLAGLPDLILRVQRELFVVGAEIAASPDARDRLVDGETQVSGEMVESIEQLLLELEGHVPMPREFVVPGETRTSASIELGRTFLRRAERRVVTLERAGMLPDTKLLAYLNRLADLLWVLARAAEQAEAKHATPSRPTRRRRAGTGTDAGRADRSTAR